MVGAAAGAAAGTVTGPVGTVVGPAGGAVVGGLAGKGVAEANHPTREDVSWRDNYSDRPYVEQGLSHDDYGPAYGSGAEAASRHLGRGFEDAKPELSRRRFERRGGSNLHWDSAKDASRDASNRVESAVDPSAKAGE